MFGVATAVGCLSHTLPVPPPLTPSVSAPDADGIVVLKGGPGSAFPQALVTVWNQRIGEGRSILAKGDGSWQRDIPAQVGDLLQVYQEHDLERSVSVDVQVPASD